MALTKRLQTPTWKLSREIEEVIERCMGILPIFVGRYDEGLAIKKAFSDE